LNLLEKSLCSTDDVDRSTAMLAELSGLPPELLLSIDTQPLSEFYADDLSDTEEGTASCGVMVHSESTMTVVARPVIAEANDAATVSSDTSLSVVLSDAEARRLHHSKSWPQSADGRRAAASVSLDGVTPSAVTVYGNQQFNFNLPHNTSTEQLHSDPRAAASGHFTDHSIIYLSSPTSSVGDDPQIAYITDELCRIFCTDTVSLEDDDDNVELTADVPPNVDGVELSTASADIELSASVQQQCLPVISCDCDDVMAASNEAPSSTETSALTVNVSSLNTTELSADAQLASNHVEPLLSSSATELPSSSADSLADVVSSSDETMTSTNNGRDDGDAAEDVAIAMLEESCSDVSESAETGGVLRTSHVGADGDTKLSESTSTEQSLHPHHSEQSSPAPVIETDAAKTGDGKGHNLSHGWNSTTAASNSVELIHDRERCANRLVKLPRFILELVMSPISESSRFIRFLV